MECFESGNGTVIGTGIIENKRLYNKRWIGESVLHDALSFFCKNELEKSFNKILPSVNIV